MPDANYRLIRIRATGQVTEMAPGPARAMLNSGIAEEVNAGGTPQVETMALGRSEAAVAAPQSSPRKKRA